MIVGIWFVCVGIQRFVVPFDFDHVFKPYQVKRIYDAIGKEYVPEDQAAEVALENEEEEQRKKENRTITTTSSKVRSPSAAAA